MRRVLYKLITLFSFFILSITLTHWYETQIKLDVTLQWKEGPVDNKVILYVWPQWENIKYLTNKKWKIEATFPFDSEKDQTLELRIDQNRITVREFDSQDIEPITISYDKENNEITGVTGIKGGKVVVSNQEIVRSTNYPLLLTYIFLTVLILTIFGWWRYLYNELSRDIEKHRRK